MDNHQWSRRPNTAKLSLTTPGGANGNGSSFSQVDSSKPNLYSRRHGADSTSSLGRSNPVTPGGGLVSPTSGASSAFGIGSGAFAGFGSKTPKAPGTNPFDISIGAAAAGAKAAAEKVVKEKAAAAAAASSNSPSADKAAMPRHALGVHPLETPWAFWFRPPITKANGFIEYEKTLHPIARVTTVQEFFTVYRHLKRPSDLPPVSDYHLFKDGIRPIWEDKVNKKGGKWVVRIKKGIADRYWEHLLLAMVGGQFDSGDVCDVCGIVLSVRNGEDIISVWARSDGPRVLKIRETMKRALNLPEHTKVEWKSHDESIQQRVLVEESRREKNRDREHTDGRGKATAPDSSQKTYQPLSQA